MSGICGIIRFDGKDVTHQEIQTFLDAMDQRGGDHEDFIINRNMGFGHKMLWTTPESKYEKLPFRSNDGNLTIVSDARIDNREELIKKLNLDTNKLTPITDSELILYAYQSWGEDCINYLYGDFSFAIWNHKNEQLFCARDRIGIRQLYYHLTDNNTLIFCTSINPIFSFPQIKRELDNNALAKYVEHLSLNRDETFFMDIKRLPSSSKMLFDRNRISINRYWFPEQIHPDYAMSMEEAVSGFKWHFEQAINSCLRSAYPIAFDVSGGLDSSSVFCTALKSNPSADYIPCAMEYNIETCNEQKYIDDIEKKCDINIYKINVSQIDYSKKNLSFLYKQCKDWPTLGVSIESMVKDETLEQFDVRVVLTGVGGDEVIGGSHNYLTDYIKKFKWYRVYKELKCINLSFKMKVKYLKMLIINSLPKKVKNIINTIRMKQTVSLIEKDSKLNEITDNIQFDTSFIHDDFLILLSCDSSYFMDMNQMQLAESRHFEYRHPFFDVRLIEFILQIPPELKSQCARYKNILKKSMRETLPASIANRTSKAEFSQSILMQMKKIDEIKNHLECNYLVKKNLLSSEKIKKFRYNFEHNLLTQAEIVEYWAYLNLEKWLLTKEDDEKSKI